MSGIIMIGGALALLVVALVQRRALLKAIAERRRADQQALRGLNRTLVALLEDVGPVRDDGITVAYDDEDGLMTIAFGGAPEAVDNPPPDDHEVHREP